MKKCLSFPFNILFVLLSLSSCSAPTENIVKETYTFIEREGTPLLLDKYDIPGSSELKPCIIFVFGGGFAAGSRDNKNDVAFCEKMAESGYVVVAIDYRLGMKDVKMGADSSPIEFAAKMMNTINIAVEDLYAATAFVYNNAEIWGVNKEQIIACGSSAGAITVLQGEYLLCNEEGISNILPENFRYAGIIGFAGAIYSITGDLVWKRKPSPIQLFHGDADKNVPFDAVTMWQFGFYGSKYIASRLEEMKTPYYFYEVLNTDHSVAGSPMTMNVGEINSFIRTQVIGKRPFMIHTVVNDMDKPETKKDFTLEDFIWSNYQ